LGFPAEPGHIFGHSLVTAEARESGHEHAPGAYQAVFDMAKCDSSLREILAKNDLCAETLAARDSSGQAVLKKLVPTAFLRNHVMDTSGPDVLMGDDGKPGPYWGVEAIYAMSDGNPRWLLRIIDSMMEVSAYNAQGACTPIPDRTQARVLTALSREFERSVRAIPASTADTAGPVLSAGDLLNAIGEQFFNGLYGLEFPLDPAGSFCVDQSVSEEVLDCLARAARHGAIISVDPADQSPAPDLRGRNFRLSFMLSPTWNLPLRRHRPVHLSTCLRQIASSES
jgi:hypothetical protein